MKINFHKVNDRLNMNNVKEYLQNRYPIYNAKLLQNLLIEDGYYDIFHVDGELLEDKDHLMLLSEKENYKNMLKENK